MIQSIQPITAAKHTEQLTHQAQKLVAQTFYGTLMKQMHDSPFKSQLMDGGRGGAAFQPLMDQHLIDRMAKASGNKAGKLIRSVVRRLDRNEGLRKSAEGVSTTSPASGKDGRSLNDGSSKQNYLPTRPAMRQNRVEPNPLHDARFHVAPGLRA